MPWPPTPSSSFLLEAAAGTSILWGTDGIISGYIVVSCAPADEVETLYVENGTGLKVVRIILWQGRRVNITVVDDVATTPPNIGTTITMLDPLSKGVSTIFRVIEQSGNAARKEASQRTIAAEYLTMIEGAGTPLTP